MAKEAPPRRSPPTPLSPVPKSIPPEVSVGSVKAATQAQAALSAPPQEHSLELDDWDGGEHRQFPRAHICVPFALTIGQAPEIRFSATLGSFNLSVSGAFLESTYFLPVGTELHVSFRLDAREPAVEARAEIIRQERPDPRTGAGRSGFAIRFLEFYSQTEVTLAKLFLGERLRAYAEHYLQSERARSLTTDLDRVVDALAAWELSKVISSDDVWRKK